jgi:hypothetical protein
MWAAIAPPMPITRLPIGTKLPSAPIIGRHVATTRIEARGTITT